MTRGLYFFYNGDTLASLIKYCAASSMYIVIHYRTEPFCVVSS